MSTYTHSNWCPKCGKPYSQPKGMTANMPLCEGHPASASGSLPLFPSGTFGYYEIAYVIELQKVRDELIEERDKLKAEQDELKDKIDRLNRMAASDPNWIYCLRGFVDGLKTNLEMMTNEREEARHWARKYYKWARCYYELLCERDKLNREKTGNAIANLEDVIENQSEFYGLGFSEREFLECITERINLVIASLKKDVDIESCDRKTMDNTSEHWLPQGRGG